MRHWAAALFPVRHSSAGETIALRVFSGGDLPETRSQALAPITLRPIPIHTTGARLASNDFLCVLRENVPLRTLVLRDPLGPRITAGGEGDPGPFELSVHPGPALRD